MDKDFMLALPTFGAVVPPKLALTVPATFAGSTTRTAMILGALLQTDCGRRASIFPKPKQNPET